MKHPLLSIPKIFIGSSTRSYGLVQFLAQEIRAHEMGIPIEWKAGGFAPSKSTLQNLIEQCRICDFAVIFLTRDDEKRAVNKDDKENIFRGPRDNTIFEVGLFVGGLGLEPERCILISSVDESMLPSDIKGITYIEIDEPPPADPPNNRLSQEWCRENLQKVYESVEFSITRYGEFHKRPLLNVYTKKQLASIEQVGKNCLEKYDTVVINSSEPEDCCDFYLAKAVAENLKRKVNYNFHFRLQKENIINLCNQWIDLIRILIATSCIDDKSSESEGDLKREEDIVEFLSRKEDKALEAIEVMRNRLRIFLNTSPHPIPFRIAAHNVSSFEKAKCYLRFDNYFVEWFYREDARDAMRVIEGKVLENSSVNKIFHGSDSFTLYNEDVDDEIKEIENSINSFCDKTELTISNPSHFAKLWYEHNHIQDIDLGTEIRNHLVKVIDDLFPKKKGLGVLGEKVKCACLGEKCIKEHTDNLLLNKSLNDIKLQISDKEDANLMFDNDSIEKLDKILKDDMYKDINRIPIFNHANRSIYNIINKSTLEELSGKKQNEGKPDTKVKEFIQSVPHKKDGVPLTWAVLSGDYNAIQAKDLISIISNCHDVFITKNGKPEGSVISWVPEEKL